jgi:radical SAM superfamily enzyme YgiQ (UPF0313 family)
MSGERLDVLFVTPDASAAAYQDLSHTYSAIEPPTWSLLLAQSCRAKGFHVAILDCIAERLDDASSMQRIRDANPRLVCFVLYGQNPNSGTTSMIGANRLGASLKETYPEYPICMVGSHVSALPREVLGLPFVDIVLLNEGVYALHELLASDLDEDLPSIKGIGYTRAGQGILNAPQRVVPQERMDIDLPGYAWDLLPYRAKPLDLYRAHLWHANYDLSKRTPFAALYTSLGCRFKCDFCMINIVNREDNDEHVTAAESAHMRFWSPEFMIREFDKLAAMGVETIRICDEMFFLDRRYFEPLLKALVERDYHIRSWSYARVDSVQPKYLELFKQAGIDWLAIGIEAGNQQVRRQVSKGSFQDVNIREIVRTIQESGINVGANYIFGFPDDTLDTMQQTLDLALELNTEFVNMYNCQALPGSPMHELSRRNGWALPDSYEGYAFLSYECQPMPTKHLSAKQVLQFRDKAWRTYYTHEPYLDLIQRKFGLEQRRTIEDLSRIQLKRRLLED